MAAATLTVDPQYMGSIVQALSLIVASLMWTATGLRAVALLAQHGQGLGHRTRFGIALGPLTAIWALYAVSRQSGASSAAVVEIASGERGPGDLSIVIAVLGDPERVAVADPLLRRLSDRVREIVLLRPVTGDAGLDDGPAVAMAARRLSHAALFVPGPQPRLVVTASADPAAITCFTRQHRPGLVIVVENR
jgi:hypothetical protein